MAVRLICGAELLHIPKTGGSWVTSVLEKNDLIAGHSGHMHADYDRNQLRVTLPKTGRQHLYEAYRFARKRLLRPFQGAPAPPPTEPFRFCFVRHPLSWYESWWKFNQGRGWQDWGTQNSETDWHPNSTLNGLASDDFNQFMRNVVQARPGYVTELYYSYTKPGISFIGKTENLREDLSSVLEQLGHRVPEETIYDSPKENISKLDQSSIEWDPELKQLVTKLEINSLLHFGYLTETEKRELGIDMSIPPNPVLSPNGRSNETDG